MRLLTLIAILCIGFASCGDDELDIPTCINDKLETFKDEACEETDSTLPGDLRTFTFRTELVYCFNWGSCSDRSIEIWTEDCEVLCLMGGPDETIICDGTDWESNAELVDVIWPN